MATLSVTVSILPPQVSAAQNTSYVYPPWGHTWGVVRATPFKLRLFVGNKTHFNDPQGLAVARLAVWDDTARTGDDDEITAYGVNSGDDCIVYNRSMYSLGIYGLDRGDERLNRPWGIAANSHGDVYVADRSNQRVVRLFNPGHNLLFAKIIGGPGDDSGQFIDPCGVALDSHGNLYVTDAALGRVTVFNDSGYAIQFWDGFDGPDGIAVTDPGEEWSYRHEGFAVVIDSLHSRVSKVNLDGQVVSRSRAADWGATNAYLGYVTLDLYNQLLITDRNNCCLHKLDRDLNYLTSFGEPGRGDYQFDQPRGIALYRRFGQILVAERQGAQYLWVGVDVADFRAHVRADSIRREVEVDFRLTEPGMLDLTLQDASGRFIAPMAKGQRFNAGAGHLSWSTVLRPRPPDLVGLPALPPEYHFGERLPDGEYLLRAQFRATYSSRDSFHQDAEAKFRLH